MESQSALLQVEKEWIDAQPRRQLAIDAIIGKSLRSLGANNLAVKRLLRAAAAPNRGEAVAIHCANALVACDVTP